MNELSHREMTATKEFRQRCREMGARVRELRIEKNLSEAQLGAVYGVAADAVRHLESGHSGGAQFVKLGEIARKLDTTPNYLLGVESPDLEAFTGLLEGLCIALGQTPEEAQQISDTVLKLKDSPGIRNSGSPPRDSARSVGLHVIGEYSRKEKFQKLQGQN